MFFHLREERLLHLVGEPAYCRIHRAALSCSLAFACCSYSHFFQKLLQCFPVGVFRHPQDVLDRQPVHLRWVCDTDFRYQRMGLQHAEEIHFRFEAGGAKKDVLQIQDELIPDGVPT